jgi:hypothetical protein
LALARGSGGAGAWWSAVAAAVQGLGAAELRERAELGLRAAAVRRDGGKGSAGALLIGRRPTWACVPAVGKPANSSARIAGERCGRMETGPTGGPGLQ